ncbi:MAG: MFS transporter, partial [Candidatus Omnitrophica bacterium]|nr:MFS transporter [Candidatus Omnitrophota bacterium]
ITTRENLSQVSGIGRAFGYSGAILAIYLSKPLILKQGYQAVFLLTGILFFVFSLPCLLLIKDNSQKKMELFSFLKKERILLLFRNLKQSFLSLKDNATILNFLKASFFGLCVINAVIIFMAVYVSRVFGWNEELVAKLIAFSTLFAILGSLGSGYLSRFWGYKRSLIIICILWFLSIFSATFSKRQELIWMVGPLVGLALGSSWVVFRAYLVRALPKEIMGEVFGLFNLAGYFSAILGSLFLGGLFSLFSYFGNYGYRLGIWSLNLFLVFCFIYILRLPADI